MLTNLKPVVYCLIILFTAPLLINAQEPVSKYGKVSKSELEMKIYDKDTAAVAVILFDKGSSEIKYIQGSGFVVVFNNHTRIKILKKEGLDYANAEIELYKKPNGAKDKLTGIKAATYNLENGKVVSSKLSRSDIFDEDVSPYKTLRKFALQNVKVGSVIEYKYSVLSEYFYIRPWYFQAEIPVKWSEYRVLIPEYFDFKHFLSPYLSPYSVKQEGTQGTFPGGGVTYAIEVGYYAYKDVPAFKTEEYITTPDDYLAKVEFELLSVKFPGSGIQTFTSSWVEICNKLMARDDFGTALNRHGIVKDITQLIDINEQPEQKMIKAYNILRKKMKWNGYYGIFAETTLRSAYNKGEGNTADINLLLVNLLRSLDIDAYPTLLSTRSHGVINKWYPKQSSFNHVIAYVKTGDKHYFLDASDDFVSPGELPYQCMNKEGLVVSKPKPMWKKLRTKEVHKKSIMAMMNLKDNQISADINRRLYSLAARDMRYKILKQGEDKYIKDYKDKQENWEIESYTLENISNDTKPVIEKIKISEFSNIDTDADLIYLPAIIMEDDIKNPFKDVERKYPVDFGVPISVKYLLIFQYPDNYEIDELPQSSIVTIPEKGGRFVYQTKVQKGMIQIVCQINIYRTLFKPEEYKYLHQFYAHIAEKLNEQIVLKRI